MNIDQYGVRDSLWEIGYLHSNAAIDEVVTMYDEAVRKNDKAEKTVLLSLMKRIIKRYSEGN